MPVDSRFYVHPTDKTALKALQAIPGFHQALKAFMNVWNEKLFKIENMSSNLRVSDKQLKKYYDMLPPICEKLGIEIPELYVVLDVYPNAWTSGDTSPFICITTGLLDTFPDELIRNTLAHECGHIACHHVLYSTMGQMILSGASFFISNELITAPLKMAFWYWMRCSEFSADRAAIICEGHADNMAKSCMYFAGYNPKFGVEADIEAFMEQAEEYIELTKNNKVNKAMEFIQFYNRNHPLNAVRAYEAVQWTKSESFKCIMEYESNNDESVLDEILLPVPDSSKNLIGKNYKKVKEDFLNAGFRSVDTFDVDSKDRLKKAGAVLEITIDGKEIFADDEWFKANVPISIRYKRG